MSQPRSPDDPHGKALVPGRHHVSEMNFRPEVTADYTFPDPLGLIDSTVRKVVYTYGVRPSEADVIAICELLDELGVEEESLNVWWRGPEPAAQELAALKAVMKSGASFKACVFSDTFLGNGTTDPAHLQRTVDLYAGLGVKIVNPGLNLPPDASARSRQIDQMAHMAEVLRDAGMEWNATVANCGRIDFDGLLDLTNAAIEVGVRRLDLMDSTSALSPQAMAWFVRSYRSGMVRPTPMTMHTHDDFGMATAATIAAVTAGASPDVALNGVSYRSGFAALEEVVLALDVLYGVDTGIRLDRIQSVAERLAQIMGFPIPPLKPVIGSHQFLRESPGEIARIEAGEGDTGFATMGSSVSPALTGAAYSWVYAAQGNAEAVRSVAAGMGLTPDAAQLARITEQLDGIASSGTAYPRWATPDEVRAAIRAVCEG